MQVPLRACGRVRVRVQHQTSARAVCVCVCAPIDRFSMPLHLNRLRGQVLRRAAQRVRGLGSGLGEPKVDQAEEAVFVLRTGQTGAVGMAIYAHLDAVRRARASWHLGWANLGAPCIHSPA